MKKALTLWTAVLLAWKCEAWLSTTRALRTTPPTKLTVDFNGLPHRQSMIRSGIDSTKVFSSRKSSSEKWIERIVSSLSQNANVRLTENFREVRTREDQRLVHSLTLMRVGIPSIVAGLLAFMAFPSISLWVASFVTDASAFSVLSQDAGQFVQNFLSVAGLLFSILVGQTCKSARYQGPCFRFRTC